MRGFLVDNVDQYLALRRSSRTAVFRQIDKDVSQVHHDALEFPDGTFVLLTDLHEGQQATVLQLPAQPKTLAEAAVQTRVVYVG
jgi:hypothetical protein